MHVCGLRILWFAPAAMKSRREPLLRPRAGVRRSHHGRTALSSAYGLHSVIRHTKTRGEGPGRLFPG